MKRIELLFSIIFTSAFSASSFAQPASDSLNYPRLNKPCPDFVLKHIKYYSKEQVRLGDFKGKWLLLSFWNKRCAACVASFPSENRWYLKYGDKMQFLSVAIQDKEKDIEPLFLRYKQLENLSFPVAFDSLLAARWNIFTGPDFILIDPDGIVRKRGGMSSNLLDAFITGKNPKVPPVPDYEFQKDPRAAIDYNKPFLTDGNGGADSSFSYRSLISEYDCLTQTPWDYQKDFIDEDSSREGNKTGARNLLKDGMIQILGMPLVNLYSYAWLGVSSPYWINKFKAKSIVVKPELLVRDSSLFRYTDCDNLFCYSLKLPKAKASKEKIMHMMQGDLENYFGFTASVEQRKITTWKLIAIDRNKLKTKGGKPTEETTTKTEDYKAINEDWGQVFTSIFNGRLGGTLEVADSTGITGNVDINMHCFFIQIETVKKALKENGLELLPVETIREALVIKDAKE